MVTERLRECGETVYAHDDLFPQGTYDEGIRRDSLPRRALLAAEVAAFMLARGDVNGAVMASAFVDALPRMKKALRRFDVPFIASVAIDGRVVLMHDADGPVTPPKQLK